MSIRWIVGASLASLVVIGLAALLVMLVKDRTYVPSAPFVPQGLINSEVAVVYYSRSGHSESVARETARLFNAPIARIETDSYPLTTTGQWKAVADAKAGEIPEVRVEPVDLTPVRRIFLVSPLWMFRPATPLWAYVNQADLEGKEVVLVTTGNSRFEQKEIDRFAIEIQRRGGNLSRHIFIRRGRIFWQLSREQLLRETRDRLEPIR